MGIVFENKLKHLVCSGRMSLADAQRAIANDWISAYKRFVSQVPAEKRRHRNDD